MEAVSEKKEWSTSIIIERSSKTEYSKLFIEWNNISN